MFFEELETERLYLKNISVTDREFIFTLFSHDKVNQFLFDAEPLHDIEGADEIIDFYLQAEPRSQHRWILVRKDDGGKLGTCGFHCWDRLTDHCDVGYDLHPNFWGFGYMSEAMHAILSFAKDKMKIKQVNAWIYPDNVHSMRVAEKLGFIDKGITKDAFFRGETYTHKILSLAFATA